MLRSKNLLKQKLRSQASKQNKPSFICDSKQKYQCNSRQKIMKSKSKSNQRQITHQFTPNKCNKKVLKPNKLLTCATSGKKHTLSPNTGSKSIGKKVKQNLLTQQYFIIKTQFQQAVVRIFHILDIFSKGFVNQISLSKWVPEEALYFLGSVFQKIKINKLNLNLNQFIQQCYKVFEKSTELDVRQFINNVSKHKIYSQTKKSLLQHKQTQQSQSEEKLGQLNIAGNQLNKISAHYSKTFTMRIAKQSQVKETDMNQKTQRNNVCIDNTKRKTEKSSLSPLTKMNQFQNVAIGQGQNKKQTDIIKNFPIFSKPIQKEKCCQSPFFKDANTNKLNSTNFVNRRDKLSSDRLQKLSMKLEDYIKENKARLERSQKARCQI